jgi:hypothetical protein
MQWIAIEFHETVKYISTIPQNSTSRPSFPDRKCVLGKRGGKELLEKKRSSNLRERKLCQEDDHGCIRPIIRTLEPTSQGTVSELA